jgi:endonuclease/exonuclease/phosphatase family metal-dependent hydrolase
VAGNGQIKEMRIVSWNIDHGSGSGKSPKNCTKAAPICACCRRWIGMRRVRCERCRDGTGRKNAAYGVEFEELSQEKSGPAYIGQATLTRLPLRQARVLRFPRQSTFWRPHGWLPSALLLMQRRLGNRIALVTELEFAGRPLVVYNPHLESRGMGLIQTEQLDEMLADMRRYAAGTTIMIAGDLNSKYFPAVFLHKLEKAGFRSVLGGRIERTHVIAMALDWIFVRGPVTLEGGSVRRDAKGSDHYPIAVHMKAQGGA